MRPFAIALACLRKIHEEPGKDMYRRLPLDKAGAPHPKFGVLWWVLRPTERWRAPEKRAGSVGEKRGG